MKNLVISAVIATALFGCAKNVPSPTPDPQPENCTITSVEWMYGDLAAPVITYPFYNSDGSVSKYNKNDEGSLSTSAYTYTNDLITVYTRDGSDSETIRYYVSPNHTISAADRSSNNNGIEVSATFEYDTTGYLYKVRFEYLNGGVFKTYTNTYTNGNLTKVTTTYASGQTKDLVIRYNADAIGKVLGLDSPIYYYGLNDFADSFLIDKGYFGKQCKNRVASASNGDAFTYIKDNSKVTSIKKDNPDNPAESFKFNYTCK